MISDRAYIIPFAIYGLTIPLPVFFPVAGTLVLPALAIGTIPVEGLLPFNFVKLFWLTIVCAIHLAIYTAIAFAVFEVYKFIERNYGRRVSLGIAYALAVLGFVFTFFPIYGVSFNGKSLYQACSGFSCI